jgi:hypothetical protein
VITLTSAHELTCLQQIPALQALQVHGMLVGLCGWIQESRSAESAAAQGAASQLGRQLLRAQEPTATSLALALRALSLNDSILTDWDDGASIYALAFGAPSLLMPLNQAYLAC